MGLRHRWRHLRARVGSLGLDALLVAYVLWCVDHLQTAAGAHGLLARFPALVLVTPLLAALWQATGTSLGQRSYGVRLVDGGGAPAPGGGRVVHGFCSALASALVLAPFAGIRPLGTAAWVALAVACALAGVALFGGVRGWSEAVSGVRASLRPREQTGPVVPWWRRANPWIVIGLLALTFVVGAEITEFSLRKLFEGAGRTGALWNRLFAPDWSVTRKVVDLLVETVFLALMASALALPFAFAISFLGARNLMHGSVPGRICYTLTRVLMNVARSVEPLVWAIIFILWVGVGPYAGMLALFVHSVAALGKLYSEAIESIDPGPVEAIRATGASFLQVLRYGVVPQVVPPFLSFTVYRWDINVRMATILGLVGGGGIGTLLIEYNQLGAWSKVGTIIVFITLVVWVMDIVSARARERLI